MKKFLITALIMGSISVSQADLIITKIIEGSNAAAERFIEIYNTGASSVDLSNYRIAQYANGTTAGTASLLSGSLGAGAFAYLMQSANQATFESIYGVGHTVVFAAQVSGTGNDVYALRDEASSSVLDVFGVIGVDGTGQNWLYTDSAMSRANNNYAAQSSFTYANPGAGSPGVGLTGWSYTTLTGVASSDYATVAPLGVFSPIPEPATMALLGAGLAGLSFLRRRRK